MGKIRGGHLAEIAIWMIFAVLAFYFSYEFDRPIEIYEFGASAWPRTIILFIVLAAFGQLYWYWRHGDEETGTRIGSAADDMDRTDAVETPLHYYKRVLPILAAPFIFAWLLEDIGFYTLAPLFIAAVILLLGERRWKWIVGITALIYTLLLLFFAKILYVGLPTGNIHPFYDFSNWLLALIR